MSRGTKEPRRSRRKQSQKPPTETSAGYSEAALALDQEPVQALDGLVAEVLQSSGDTDTVSLCSPLLARIAGLGEAERANWRCELERIRGELSTMGSEGASQALRERLETCLGLLAQSLGNTDGSLAAAAPANAEAKSPAPAALGAERPAWVDDAMIGDFLKLLPDTLDELEGSAVALENGDDIDLNALKRTLHTLKGEAGLLGLDALAQVAHVSEDVLVANVSRQRQGTALLDALEWMRSARLAYREGRLPPDPPERLLAAEAQNDEAQRLAVTSGDAAEAQRGQSAPTASGGHGHVAPTEVSHSPGDLAAADESAWGSGGGLVSPGSLPRDEETLAVVAEFLDETEEGLVRADQILMNVERDGLNEEATHSLFRTFHSIKGVSASLGLDAIASLAHATENVLNLVRRGSLTLAGPPLDVVFDATECMRGMLSDLRAAAQSSAELSCPENLVSILERLETIESGIPVLTPVDAASSVVRPGAPSPDGEAATGVDEPERKEAQDGGAVGAIASSTVTEQAGPAPQRGEPSRGQAPTKADFSLKEVIKVDVDRIDSLVEMIGELVIAESMVVNLPEVAGISSHVAQKYLSQLTKITRDLQRVGMSMRMVQVKTVFQKMARVVRDIAKKSNKNVTLQITGDSAEMDRGMVDAIAEPIVHMVRNSVDHGLESPEERVAQGKPEHGVIRLSATHEGGSIVIEISDDGKGLDTERILEKARSLGIVGAHQVLSDTETHELIFHPGFSTAREVTEISGRGVGMDVVKRAIEALHGRIHIETTRGVGTTFRFVLPITLAIIDGMLIAVGDESYIIPTRTVVESVQPQAEDIKTFANSSEMLLLRGELIPLLRLERIFGVQEAKQDVTECLIVVVEVVGRKVGILVDGVITQQQVVIKNLGRGINSSQYISGAAILSNGRVGLILNVEAFGHLFGENRGFGVARSAVSGAA